MLGILLITLFGMLMFDWMLITPVFIGHMPSRFCVQGSKVCFKAVKPYAMTSISAVTNPDIEDTPTTSKARLLLSGVKATLNKVAVKLELAWQGFSDFDSINRSADAKGEREAIVARESHAGFGKNEKRIMMCG